jgi:carbonic anhydrase
MLFKVLKFFGKNKKGEPAGRNIPALFDYYRIFNFYSICVGLRRTAAFFNQNINRIMELYHQVFENNRKWVASKVAKDQGFFEKLAKDQRPEFLYIGCSDSRVPANEIMGLEPGEVFVHRNIANLVVSTDMNIQSVIEYAVVHLRVRYIVVCGHYGCGGVKAAMQAKDLGILNGWLREIRDVYRLHQEELDAIADEQERYNRLIELNVREQCINVVKIASVQQRYYAEGGHPTVHGWVYDLRNGLLKDLNLDMEEEIIRIRRIYDLWQG